MKFYNTYSSIAIFCLRLLKDPRFWVVLLALSFIGLGAVSDALGQTNTPSTQLVP